jgi:hypothetical protein
LFGLQGMSSEYVEVRNVLLNFAYKIKYSNQALNGQSIGKTSLTFGCDHRASPLRILNVASSNTNSIMTAVGNALYGLKHMNCEHQEVRKLIAALTSKIIKSTYPLNAQEVSSSLFGLHNMRSTTNEVKDLMKVLANKIINCENRFNSQEVGNSLYGLKGSGYDIVMAIADDMLT